MTIGLPPFNLIEEPWIPCVLVDEGQAVELGLRDILARAAEIREIADPSPLVTISLHRLLLAILHLNFGPATAEDWYSIWSSEAFGTAQLDRYFQCWHGRFNLFDEQWPFYQNPNLDASYGKSVALMVHGLTLGNYATLFDHSVEAAPPALPPGRAARQLVAFHSFALGGLVSLQKGEDARLFKSADAAPLAKGVVTLVKGRTLFQTLLLNLHRYDPDDEIPFPTKGDDRPAWERDAPTQAEDREPAGYVDLLTWQSRRIRLLPEERDGQPIVNRVVMMKGNQFPEGWRLRDHETMLAFRENPKPRPGEDPWPVLSFQPGRALWRDSQALFQSVSGRFVRPRMQSWVAQLIDERYLDRSARFALESHGISIDRASVYFWRHERLPLPLAYLQDSELFARLGQALDLAERVGRLFQDGFDEGVGAADQPATVMLPRPLRVFAENLLAPTDDMTANKDSIRQVIDWLAPGRIYWSRLEVPFKQFVVELANDRVDYDDGSWEYGRTALPAWAETLRRMARDAFRETIDGFDSSSRALKATARAERAFNGRLNQILGGLLGAREEVTHESRV